MHHSFASPPHILKRAMSRRQRRYCFFQVNSLLINPCLPLSSVLTNKRQKTVSMPNNSLKQQNWGIIFKIQPFLVKSPLGCDKPLISILSVGIPLKLRADGRNIVGQQLPTLLDVTYRVYLNTLFYVAACCWELLRKD